MRQDNRRARKKGSLPKDQQFVQLINSFRQEPAWMALSYGARLLYVEIKALYNGQNNGRIMCSSRYAAETLGCNKGSVAAYFNDLMDKGFIVETRGGFLGVNGRGHGRLWRLTELGFMGDRPTKDYRDWKPEKNKTPYGNTGQYVRQDRTVSAEGVRQRRTGCTATPDGFTPKPAQKCTATPDDLIYQGEGETVPASPRRSVAAKGGRR